MISVGPEKKDALRALVRFARMPTVLHPDLLLVIGLIFFLLLIVLVLWIEFRRRLAQIQTDQYQQRDQLDVFENMMARIEGALFMGRQRRGLWRTESKLMTRDRPFRAIPRSRRICNQAEDSADPKFSALGHA